MFNLIILIENLELVIYRFDEIDEVLISYMLDGDSYENGFDQPRPEDKRQRWRIDEIQHEIKQKSHHQCKAVSIFAHFSQSVCLTKS